MTGSAAMTDTDPSLAPPILTTPDKVALAGDWHGDAEFAAATIEHAQAHGCEGLIQLGDFSIWPGTEGQYFLDDLAGELEAQQMWLMFIDGNHEDFWQLYEYPLHDSGLRMVRDRIWHIPRGTRWQWGDLTWLGLGGATSLDRRTRKLGVNWWPEEALTAGDAERAISGGHADIMLTHDCPSGVAIPGLSSNWDVHGLAEARAHRRMLREVCERVQPDHLFHGHFHVRYQATTQFGGIPCVVDGLSSNHDLLKKGYIIVDVAS